MQSLESANIQGIDVPIVKLTPVRKRQVSKKNYNKLMANIRAVGLIEPLCVCKEGEEYFILDGYIRYTALLELGIETAPCLVLASRDLYTPNRQVNHLSPREETKMLRKALEKLDEGTIAKAFGMDSLKERLNTALYRDLHPQVVSEMERGKLLQGTAKELVYVLPKRQMEILKMMRDSGDWTAPFAKAQILATPPEMRNRKKYHKNPWKTVQSKKRDLTRKLTEVEKHYDFYSALYRQYVGDLLKLSIYVRQMISRPDLRKYLTEQHPEDLQLFESVLAESEGKGAAGGRGA